MNISILSVISLIISILSLFSFVFVLDGSGIIKEVSRAIWYVSSVLCISFPIFAKRYRKKHGFRGRRFEIAALVIAFWAFQFLLIYAFRTNDFVNLTIAIVFCVIYAKTSNNIVPIEDNHRNDTEIVANNEIENGNSCRKCGKELPENSAYCPCCGKKVKQPKQPVSQGKRFE